MTEKVRVGIIGTSWYADFMHLPILSLYERADVVAICGRNQERAGEMADKYSVPQVFADYRRMIANGSLDAIIIATPDDTHYEMTMAALDTGLHVLCEKPVALNADHARAMYEKSEEIGVKHMVMFTFHGLPNYRHLKQLVDSGYLGRPYHGHFRYVAGYGRSPDYSWRFDGKRALGILGDLGSHLIDLSRWYLGDIANVSAHITSFIQHVEGDGGPVQPNNDSAILTLEFVNGAQATIHVSGVAYIANRDMEQTVALHGDAGTLETGFILNSPAYEIQGVKDGGGQFNNIEIPADLLQGITEENPFGALWKQSVGPRLFIDSILDDKPIEPGLYEGYKVQQVIDAALESHETGQRVTIPQ